MYKIEDENAFNKYVGEHEKVCVKFSAPWCFPCRCTAENIDAIVPADRNGWEFVEVNTDDETVGALSDRYQVSALPTLVYLVNGEEKERTVGLRTSDEIMSTLKRL